MFLVPSVSRGTLPNRTLTCVPRGTLIQLHWISPCLPTNKKCPGHSEARERHSLPTNLYLRFRSRRQIVRRFSILLLCLRAYFGGRWSTGDKQSTWLQILCDCRQQTLSHGACNRHIKSKGKIPTFGNERLGPAFDNPQLCEIELALERRKKRYVLPSGFDQRDGDVGSDNLKGH